MEHNTNSNAYVRAEIGNMSDVATDEYIKEKLELLYDMRIPYTEADVKHLYSLKTEVAVDRYVRDLMFK